MTPRATFYPKAETNFTGFITPDLGLCPTGNMVSWSPKRHIKNPAENFEILVEIKDPTNIISSLSRSQKMLVSEVLKYTLKAFNDFKNEQQKCME